MEIKIKHIVHFYNMFVTLAGLAINDLLTLAQTVGPTSYNGVHNLHIFGNVAPKLGQTYTTYQIKRFISIFPVFCITLAHYCANYDIILLT